MGTRLFVGGLSSATSTDRLRDVFAAVGPVTSVTVITDAATGQSRGYGFVEMATAAAAEAAVARLNGSELDGRRLRVELARSTPPGATRAAGRAAEPAAPRGGEELHFLAAYRCDACGRELVGFLAGPPGSRPPDRQRDEVTRRLKQRHASECPASQRPEPATPSTPPAAAGPAHAEGTVRVALLPIDLRPSDVVADADGEWELVGPPALTGSTVTARVRRVGGPADAQRRSWPAHERLSVIRRVSPPGGPRRAETAVSAHPDRAT
jgi:hypothetical protein